MDILNKSDLKALQNFLDKVAQMNVNDVERVYKRQDDKQDIFLGKQVHHFEVNHTFRIHTIIESGLHKIVRMDPKHKVHKMK